MIVDKYATFAPAFSQQNNPRVLFYSVVTNTATAQMPKPFEMPNGSNVVPMNSVENTRVSGTEVLVNRARSVSGIFLGTGKIWGEP